MLGRAVRMSGSGSSLFTLFDDESAAKDAAAHIERDTRERALAVEVSPIFRDDLNEDFEDR
jgi:4-diphosphocytidyl-2C-methyl-D-erythritol kinase